MKGDTWGWKHIHDWRGENDACIVCGWDGKTYPWWCISANQMGGLLMMWAPFLLSGSPPICVAAFIVLYLIALIARNF